MALEALKGIKTIQQIAKEFDIHPVQVSDWKKTMAQGAAYVKGPSLSATMSVPPSLSAISGELLRSAAT